MCFVVMSVDEDANNYNNTKMNLYNSTLSFATWRMGLASYLGRWPMATVGRVADIETIRRTEECLRYTDLSGFMVFPYAPRPDLIFRVKVTEKVPAIVVIDRETRECLGGAIQGVPFIFSHHRGNGYGAEIVAFSDMNGRIGLKPVRYSISGLRGRVGAHRRHVERALQYCPDDVAPEALSPYMITKEGTLSCVLEWGPTEQMDWFRNNIDAIKYYRSVCNLEFSESSCKLQ